MQGAVRQEARTLPAGEATERIAARYPELGEVDLEALIREERDR
jgi:hypothetical protein